MTALDDAVVAQNRGTLQHIAQLPDVARPTVPQQRITCLVGQTGSRDAERLLNGVRSAVDHQEVRPRWPFRQPQGRVDANLVAFFKALSGNRRGHREGSAACAAVPAIAPAM